MEKRFPNPFTIADIAVNDILKIPFQMELIYDGIQDEAIFATRMVDDYFNQNTGLYPRHELNHFMIYCSHLRDAICACVHQGIKCKIFVDFNDDFVYCLSDVG